MHIDPVAQSTKASDLFIQCLEEEGVEYIFGVPGEENLDFLDSLSRSTSIKLILTRHEQGAGFMAATYGRHTGKTGVCVATLGPGDELRDGGSLCAAWRMPILMIMAEADQEVVQGASKILDVVAMMGRSPNSRITCQRRQYPTRARGFRLAEEENRARRTSNSQRNCRGKDRAPRR